MTAKIIPLPKRRVDGMHYVGPPYRGPNGEIIRDCIAASPPRSVDDLWPAVAGSTPHPAIWPYPESEDRE